MFWYNLCYHIMSFFFLNLFLLFLSLHSFCFTIYFRYLSFGYLFIYPLSACWLTLPYFQVAVSFDIHFLSFYSISVVSSLFSASAFFYRGCSMILLCILFMLTAFFLYHLLCVSVLISASASTLSLELLHSTFFFSNLFSFSCFYFLKSASLPLSDSTPLIYVANCLLLFLYCIPQCNRGWYKISGRPGKWRYVMLNLVRIG